MSSDVTTALGRAGLGTFPFSGVFGPLGQEAAAAILDAHLAAGGRYVETAPSYPAGAVDLGALLRAHPRDRFAVGSKCGTARDAAGCVFLSGRRAHLMRQCHAELERLGIDRLDLFQLHHVPVDAPAHETMRALGDLRAEGLVRSIGVSNVTLPVLARLHALEPIDVVQTRLSLVHDEEYRQIAAFCAEAGIVANPYQVIERGLLAGERGRSFAPRQDDLRRSKPEYLGLPYRTVRAWYEQRVLPIAARHGIAPEQLAIGWALRRPQVTCCVVGARTPEQARRNATTVSLGSDVMAELADAKASLVQVVRRDHGVDLSTFRGVLPPSSPKEMEVHRDQT